VSDHGARGGGGLLLASVHLLMGGGVEGWGTRGGVLLVSVHLLRGGG